METSVYETPKSDLNEPSKKDYVRLKKIARRQRALLICILIQILLNPLVSVLGLQSRSVAVVLTVVMLFLLILIVVDACRLSMLFNHVVVTVLLTLFAIVPLLNLIVLLILSRQSTNELKRNGIKVGLLGANPKKIGHEIV